MKKTHVYPGRSVHITREDLGGRVRLRINKEYEPEGVSFAPTVRNALEGVPFYYTRERKDWGRRRRFLKEGDEWYVYTPVRKRVAIIPGTVDDYKRTRERRVLSEVEVRRVGKIKVKIGNNRWEYQWMSVV